MKKRLILFNKKEGIFSKTKISDKTFAVVGTILEIKETAYNEGFKAGFREGKKISDEA